MTTILDIKNAKFKFQESLNFNSYTNNNNIYCVIDITVKKLKYSDSNMFYYITYKTIYSSEDKECYKLNPLLNDNNEFYDGEIIACNSLTDEFIKYLLMPYEELKKYSGNNSAEQYKRQTIQAIKLYWD